MKELIYENLCDDFREKFLSLVKHSCYLRSSVTHIVQADYINIFEKSNNVKLKFIMAGYYSSNVKYYVNNVYKYEFDFLIECDTLILSISDLVTDNELARYYFTFDNGVVADFFNTEENTSELEPELQSRKAKSIVKINKKIFYNLVKKYFSDVDLPARKDFDFLRSFNSRTYILNYCNSDYSVILNFCLEIKANNIYLSFSETGEVHNLAI